MDHHAVLITSYETDIFLSFLLLDPHLVINKLVFKHTMTLDKEVKQLNFWSYSLKELELKLQASIANGLTSENAEGRLSLYGKNTLKFKKNSNFLVLLTSQFKSPIILIFIFTTVLSLFLGQLEDATLIIIIIIISAILGFWQERGAINALDKLLAIVQSKISVLRDGSSILIPTENIVPGDIVTLTAGDSIPADSFIIESKDLFVNEATLTGESYPVEKFAKILPKETPLRDRSNSVFMGTFVVSGKGKVLAIRTGANSEFGEISNSLKYKNPATDFEHGVRKFGYFLIEVTLLLVISNVLLNIYFGRSILESFLFSLALAIGLTPQLLPAIISVNLAHGARRMLRAKVIVKRLAALENLGSMNILCSDKTGTLTVGTVQLESAIDMDGKPNDKVLLYSYLNAAYETAFMNPIDKAIKDYCSNKFDLKKYDKIDEIPYDFIRKRLTVLVSLNDNSSNNSFDNKNSSIITKGALNNILEVCSTAERYGKIIELSKVKKEIYQRYEEYGKQGLRVLGICYKNLDNLLEPNKTQLDKQDEIEMTFLGFVVFSDPIKNDVIESITKLRNLGISIKIISGDNKYVVANLAKQIGIFNSRILIGQEIHKTSFDALVNKVNDIDIFAEIEPNQKEQIILALRVSESNVVGYLGDGINDATAIHAADVGISVNSAPNVTKDASDFVLLEKDLMVLAEGVVEGRRTFANTLKYVFMATSANFGNMFSMAVASIFLPFLPLLPKQILLMNLLTDLPEMTISTDNVDHETLAKPRRWDIKFIRRFMIVFGLLSTLFDLVTFGILLYFLQTASIEQFRTTWFIESITSACIIVLIIRTARPIFKSKPNKYLTISSFIAIGVVMILPFTPIGRIFGLSEIPVSYIVIIGLIVPAYALSAEIIKKIFYQSINHQRRQVA